jgi:uncharacterized protein (TIRG00374 family)
VSISKRAWQIASLLFGLALLALILSRVDREALWAHFSQARPGPLLAAIAGIAFLHVLKSIRWKLMLDAQGLSLGWGEALVVYMASKFLGVLTPGRFGDLTMIWYLRQAGHSTGRASVSVLIDRVLDWAALMVITGVALIWYARMLLALSPRLFALSAGATAIMLAGGVMVVVVMAGGGGRAGDWLIERLPTRLVARVRGPWLDFRRGWEELPSRLWLPLVLLTVISWLMYLAVICLLTRTVGLTLGVWQTISFYAHSTIVSTLPLSVMGIGTRDAMLLLIFALFDEPASSALAFSACLLFNYLALGLLGALAYLIRPLPLTNQQDANRRRLYASGDHDS